MNYLYKIGYYSFEESSYTELSHVLKFTQQEITEMIAEAIMALKDKFIPPSDSYNFDRFFSGDYQMDVNIVDWLIQNKKFKRVAFQEVWQVFGWADVFDVTDWEDSRGATDKELVNALDRKRKNG